MTIRGVSTDAPDPSNPVPIMTEVHTNTMTVTLTNSYKQFCQPATVEMIESLMDENYDLEAMLQFIDEHNEKEFVAHYEEYVRCGEAIGYEAVDALIGESGMDAVENCDERYRGCYQSTADFAEELCTDLGYIHDVPAIVVVDWEATWDRNLYYDFTACNDGGTYCPIHIFADY